MKNSFLRRILMILLCLTVAGSSFLSAVTVYAKGYSGEESTREELAKVKGRVLLDEEVDYTMDEFVEGEMLCLYDNNWNGFFIPVSYIESLPLYPIKKGCYMVETMENDNKDVMKFTFAGEWLKDYKHIANETGVDIQDWDRLFVGCGFPLNDYLMIKDLLQKGNYIYSYSDGLVFYDNVEQLIELMKVKSSDKYDSLPIYNVPDKKVAKIIAEAINSGEVAYKSVQFSSEKAETMDIKDKTVNAYLDEKKALENCGYGSSSDKGKDTAKDTDAKTDSGNEGKGSGKKDTAKDTKKDSTSGSDNAQGTALGADVNGHEHEYAENILDAPTCEESGIAGYTCDCGDYYEEVIEPLGHDYREVSRVDATCTENGKVKYQCINCGDKKEEVIIAPGHVWKLSKHKDSSCTEAGFDEYVCEVCGEISTEEIPMKEHNYVEVERLEPTCYSTGLRVFRCSECSDEYEEVIGKLEHTEELVTDKEPTFFFDGSGRKVCSVCGEEIETVVLDKTGFITLWLVLLVGALAVGAGIICVAFGFKKKKERK